ncbi:MAG: PfkB family carbohydrate kinase [Planctomycetota bacterium]
MATKSDGPSDAPSTYHRKIVPVSELIPALENQCGSDAPGSRRKTVIQCHGCFDIVHPGHIRYLQFARAQGDILVVSITGDALISKGETRPYIPQELRAENLAALEFVDYVVIDSNPTARDLLDRIRPDVYVKGEEYATSHDPRFIEERDVVESHGGRVIFSSGQVVFSSTRLMEALSQSPQLDVERLRAVSRRHDIDTARLGELIRAFFGRKFVVFGDSLVDRYVLCDANEIASEAPMMALTELDAEDYLGGAANVALQAAALGAEVVLVTSLGNDSLSGWVQSTLTSFGIRILTVHNRNDIPVHSRFLVDDRKLFRVSRGRVRPMDSISERKAADTLRELSGACDVMVSLDCGYGLVTPGLVQRVGDDLRRAPLLASGTGTSRGDLLAIRDVDLMCCSERRLRAAMNDSSAGLSSLAYGLLQRVQARSMLLTLGKRGLVTFDRRSHDRATTAWHDRLSSEYLPSFAGHVADRLGVSEAVLTVSALTLSAGGNLMQAAYLAGAIAAIRIGAVGPVPATADELHAWMSGRAELMTPPDVSPLRIKREPRRHVAHTV